MDHSSKGNVRDFLGYGQHTPNPNWPNNARIAVSFVVNYEEGGENSVLNGDGGSEVFLNETPGGASRPTRDINMETMYEYGSRCGVWRILRLFSKHDYKFTCYAVGKAVEQNPAVIQEMVRQGHEIASHNYRWIDYNTVNEETERSHVRKCIKVIQNVTGSPPAGWYTGRVGLRSRKIVWEEYKKLNIPLLYECDAYNDDLPYWINMDGDGLLVIPYTLDQNDMKFAVAPGFTSANDFYEYLKNTFDMLYAEGSTQPKMMSVGLHCRIVGKPGRAVALERFLLYISSFEDCWVTTRRNIACHWRAQFPFVPESVGSFI